MSALKIRSRAEMRTCELSPGHRQLLAESGQLDNKVVIDERWSSDSGAAFETAYARVRSGR